MVALITASAGLFMIVKKKLWAQSLCVKAVLLLQSELKRDVEELLKLNPLARRLNQRRRKAEHAMRAAVKTGNPLSLKIAGAALVAVTAEQLALRARQEAIFLRADRRRERARSDLVRASSRPVTGRRYFHRSLALEPEPPAALTPEYKPVQEFTLAHQHRFRLTVELAPDFVRRSFVQATECSASLEEKEGKWRGKIITANP